MITISLCMIVKNEEKVLARCLESVKDIVDEIIIIDTGSVDNTKNIALSYTDKVYDFEWKDDFSLARNYSFSKATKDYQMWLDADDIIIEEDKQKILKLKQTLDKNIDIVMFKYNTHFDKNGVPLLTSTRERLLKKEKNYRWKDPVHEYIELVGNIYYADDIYVTHKKEEKFTDRNLKIYEKLIKEGKKLSARNIYYYARELKDNKKFEMAIYYFQKFLESGLGWVEDNISTCYNLSICYKILREDKKAFESLLKSFEYDSPRAEITCEIGYYYIRKNDYKSAIRWFELSTKLDKPNTLGFILNDYWNYIPNIELSVCYYKLGNVKKAIFYNNQAAKYKPKSEAVINNKKFYNSIK